MENLSPLAGAIGMGWGAGFFWKVGGNYLPYPNSKLRDFSFICLILISIAFSFSLVLPKAPYSDQKSDKKLKI